jgi:uncharacterized protein (TIGR03083 family)
MSEWDFTNYESKANLLRTVRQQSDEMFVLASAPEAWEAPTAAGHWQVRDVIGHLVDTTEGYFIGFDAARGQGSAPGPLGVRGMDKYADEGALTFRGTSQDELLERLRADLAKLLDIFEALTPEEWGGLIVPHKYMGPLPSFFYPVAQLVDYAVHSWDIRQGTGRAHALEGDAADLLVPFCFIVWQSTAECGAVEPFTLGVRISGRNAGETRVTVTPDGLTTEAGDVRELPVVLEFDPASFVLTAMGRTNGGTARGDARVAERFCNLFFRI